MIEDKQKILIAEIISDGFSIYTVTWCTLFLMELVKPGIVSNYLSLPHASLFIVILGVASLVLRPADYFIIDSRLSDAQIEKVVLATIIILEIIFFFRFLDLSFILTLIFLFVTVGSTIIIYQYFKDQTL